MEKVSNTKQTVSCTILVPVYNGAIFITSFIRNTIPQMDLTDELLIVNDGSTDMNLAEFKALENFDERIRVENCVHKGLVSTLNFGVSISRGEYIARADIDDTYKNDRIRIQKSHLEKNPDVGAVFADYEIHSLTGKNLGLIPTAVTPTLMKISLTSANRTAHPVVMFRKKTFIEAGGYKQEDYPAEDLGLWIRIARHARLESIPQNLLFYRLNPSGITSANQVVMKKQTKKILMEYIRSIRLEEEYLSFRKEFRNLRLTDHRRSRELLSLIEIYKLLQAKKIVFSVTSFRYLFAMLFRFPVYLIPLFQLRQSQKVRQRYRNESR